MGIYVGCSPSHASNLALILNPRIGHVSPQFHIVFDDDFTTVQYLGTGMVPLHWLDFVCSSAGIQMYSEKQVGTWQSIPNLEIEKGDFRGKNQPLSTSNQDCEGVGDSTALFNHSKQQVSFVDQPGIENEINNPVAASDSSQNLWHMPKPINLDSSGLHCSLGTEVVNRCGKVYSNTTTPMNQDAHLHLASPQTMHLHLASSFNFKSAMMLFYTISSFGYRLSCMAHYVQEKVTVTSTSTFSNAIDSYHHVNTL